MGNSLQNKTILVVGAGGLLGSRLVYALIEEGAKVLAADINVAKMKAVLSQQKVDFSGLSVTFLPLDITNEKDVKEIFSISKNIDGAVNCTYPRNEKYGAHLFDVSLESFNENLALHLGSSFL